jgi:hypothetical protein
MSRVVDRKTVRRNGQQKICRYCTCGRKFVGNPSWASHQRWADRNGVGSEHRYAGTMPKPISEYHPDGRAGI